ncbi:LOW QUALITY PROTEIN: metallo-beta-lactamase domain-containing protein 1-like [Acropora palmata]|uniref:LOW QUALITY PROTEIN: metallo-beta-lactamase domain-containing protein 1-like n=1 Tax=Acropora palmata TaxID=6131 RepID=UPI003DA13BD7
MAGRTQRCRALVQVLLQGYSYTDAQDRYRAGGTCTLVVGNDKIILVDTESPRDKECLLNKLAEHGVSPDDINYVVCTHGHVDHVGNLNLFANAVHIVSHDILHDRDIYSDLADSFKEGIPHHIEENIEVISTPGHTLQDVSVVVRGTEHGTVVVCGDLFECEDDESSWKELSECPEKQIASRKKVTEVADWIVPGHGCMFKVEKSEGPQSLEFQSPKIL